MFIRKLWQISTFAGTYPHCRRPTRDQGQTTCTLAVHQWAAPVVPRSSKCSSRWRFHQSTATARYQNAASPTSSPVPLGSKAFKSKYMILNKWELRSEILSPLLFNHASTAVNSPSSSKLTIAWLFDWHRLNDSFHGNWARSCNIGVNIF